MVAIVSGNGFGLLTGSAAVLGQSGVFGNPNLGSNKEAAYVNVANGNLVLRGQDEYLAALGADLALTRTYNSLGDYNDGNGINWRMGLVKQITNLTGTVNTADSTVTRIDSDGSRALYTYDAALSRYVSTDGDGGYNYLQSDSSGKWIWTADRRDTKGVHEIYNTLDNGGLITSTNDQLGMRLTYQYNNKGKLSQVTDGSRGVTSFTYAGDNLSEIRATGITNGNTTASTTRTRYSYDGKGRLTEVITDLTPDDNSISDGVTYTTRYGYTDDGKVSSVSQGDGTSVSFTYVNVNGVSKIASVIDGVGRSTSFTYDGGDQTTVTDALGNRTVYRYDDKGQMLSVTAPAVGQNAQVTRFDYDALGNVLRMTSPSGNAVKFEYDANGNRISETNDAGDVTTRVYELSTNNLVSETRALGDQAKLTTHYFYDALNRLRFTVSPEGRVQAFEYNRDGLRSSVTEYSAALLPEATARTAANLLAWVESLRDAQSTANQVDYSYDPRGQVIKTSNYVVTNSALMPLALPASKTASVVVNNNNLLIKTSHKTTSTAVAYTGPEQPRGTDFRFEIVTPAQLTNKMLSVGISAGVWPNIQRVRVMLSQGNAQLQLDQTNNAQYPMFGTIKANTTYVVDITTEPNGETVVSMYEKNLGTADLRSQRVHFLLNGTLRFDAEVFEDANSASGAGTSTTIAVNNITSRNPVSKTAALVTQYVYDQHGQLLQSIDGNGKTSASFTYDGLGRQLSVTDGLGNQSLSTYTGGSRTVQVSQANGLINSSTYDSNGRVIAQTQTGADSTVLSQVTNSYDAVGRLRLKNTGPGLDTYFLYDAAGRQSAQIDANGKVTAYHYNADNQLTRTVQYANAVNTAQLKQNADGSWPTLALSSLDMTGSRSTWNLYDKAGRLEATVDANGSVVRYVYDRAGRQTQVIRRAMPIDPNSLGNSNTLTSISDTANADDQISRSYYDKDGKLRIEVDAVGYVTEHRYDALGQRIETIRRLTPLSRTYLANNPSQNDLLAASGAVANRERYFYSIRNKLVAVLDNSNHLTSYTFDANGNISTKRLHASLVTNPTAASWTDMVTADNAANNADLLTTYTYNENNQLISETAPEGMVTRYSYNKMGQLVETRVGAGSGSEHAQAMRYDLKGNLIAELNAEGAALLKNAAASDVERIWQRYAARYTYNDNNLRLSATDALGNRTLYYYDALGNVTHTINALGEVTAQTYDGFGQLEASIRFSARMDATTLATLQGGQSNAAALKVINGYRNATLDRTTTYHYDADGRRTATVDALGFRSTTTYDNFGQVVATEQQSVRGADISAPSSNPGSRNFYDVAGRLHASLTPAGSLTVYSYNALDQVIGRVTFAGEVSFAKSTEEIKALLVDTSSLRITASDQNQRFFYNSRGQIETVMTSIGADNAKTRWSVVSNTYDDHGNVLSRTAYATAVSTGTNWPPAPSIPAVSTADSITHYAYDKANRVIATATVQNAPNAGVPLVRDWTVTRNAYDGVGNLMAVTTYAKALTAVAPSSSDLSNYAPAADISTAVYYTYDAANRVATIARTLSYSPQGMVWTITSNTYDTNGKLIAVTAHADTQTTSNAASYPVKPPVRDPAKDLSTAFAYDGAGRLAYEIGTNGKLTAYHYNTSNQVTRTVQYAFLLNPQDMRDSDGNWRQLSASDLNERMAFSRSNWNVYNQTGQLAATMDANGSVVRYTYDSAGREIQQVRHAQALDPNKVGNSYELTSIPVIALNEDRISRSYYGNDGNVRIAIDAGGFVTEYRYNVLGQRTDTIERATALTRDYLDKNPSQADLLAASGGVLRRERYFYSTTGKLEAVLDNSNRLTAYAFDTNNNIIRKRQYATAVSNANLTDWRPSLTSSADLVTEYSYNLNNQIISEKAPDGLITSYRYNSQGQLIETWIAPGTDVKRGQARRYDLQGNVLAELNAEGVARLENASAAETEDIWQRYSTRHTYNANKLRLSTTDPLGNRTLYYYDAIGALTHTVNALGEVSAQAYDGFGQIGISIRFAARVDSIALAGLTGGQNDAAALNIINSYANTARDSTISYHYDADGRRTATVDALGFRSTVTYNEFGQVVATEQYSAPNSESKPDTNPGTRNFYDAAGRLQASLTTSGALTIYSYNALDQVIGRVTLARNVNFNRPLDELKKVIADNWMMRDAANDQNQRFYYNSLGQLQTVMTAIGASGTQTRWSVVRNTYDDNGNVASRTAFANSVNTNENWPAYASIPATSPADSITYYAYDAARRVTATATAQNIPDAATPTMRNWSMVRNSYDKAGNLVATTAYATPLKAVAPNAEQMRDHAPQADANTAIYYTYDAANRVATIARTQRSSDKGVVWAITSNSYDRAGNLVASTLHATAQTSSSIEKYKSAAPVADAANDRMTSYRYDAVGRLVVTIEPAGAITRLDYDSRGNLTQRISYAASASPATVDANYRPALTAADRVTRSIYDLDNRLMYSIDALGQVTEQRYDAFDNVSAVLQYAQALTAEQFNALTPDSSELPGLKPTPGADRLTRHVYDQQGRLRYTVDAGGYLQERVYDTLGKLSQTRDYLALPATVFGEELDIAAIAAESQRQITGKSVSIIGYTYDAMGNSLSVTDALKNTEYYSYDALGRKITYTNKAGSVWAYAYDSAGRLIKETAPAVEHYATDFSVAMGGWKALAPHALITLLEYDLMGNLRRRTEAAGTSQARVVRYEYDLAGRQVRIIRESTEIYDVEADARSSNGVVAPSEKNSGERVVTVGYNTFGEAVSNRDAAGNISYKVYDVRGEVLYDVDALGYVTEYKRNTFGDVSSLTRYNQPLLAGTRTPDLMNAEDFAKRIQADAGNDRTVNNDYDVLGRLVKTSEPMVNVYDQHALGAGFTFTFNASRTTDTSYDRYGQVRAVSVYGADSYGKRLTAGAEIRNFYDLRGNRTVQWTALSASADGHRGTGYATTFQYSWDGSNRVVTQVEHSEVGAWNDTLSGGGALPAASGSNRSTASAYNLAGQLVRESKIDATYMHDGRLVKGNIDTVYGYDVVGNQTLVRDALGGNITTYFDKLGRTTAVLKHQSPGVAGIADAPALLTEFKLDLLGNVVLRIDYAKGAAGIPAPGSTPTPTDAGNVDNRVTMMRYNRDGQVIEMKDAEQFARNSNISVVRTSYDVLGRAAKQWRGVTVGSDVKTSFQIMRYDVLGRVTEVETPGNTDMVNGTTQQNIRKLSAYNGFGEVTSTWAIDGDGAHIPHTWTRYDQAGRAWASNAANGIATLNLFDGVGNLSSTIVSTGDNAFPTNLTDVASTLATIAPENVLRTNYSYDLMGRRTDTRLDSDTKNYVLVRDVRTGNWNKVLREQAPAGAEQLLMLADAADHGSEISMAYRLKGSDAWIDGGPRMRTLGDYRGFSFTGLAAGDYEYRVMMKPVNEPFFLHHEGGLRVAVTDSIRKNIELARVYATLLNRVPDLAGLSLYVSRANAGESLASLMRYFLASTEASVYLGGSSEQSIKNMLRNGFGRDGVSTSDPTYASDVAFWTQAYDRAKAAGGDAPGQMILDMIETMMTVPAATAATAVQEAMTTARTRMNNSVSAGLEFAMTHRGSDQASATRIHKESASDLALAMKDAKDSGTLENQRIQIAQVYLAVFGRAPEKAGMEIWLASMGSTTPNPVIPEQMAGSIFNSPEARSLLLYPEAGVDIAAYNRQLISHVYRNVLGRTPAAEEFARWNSILPGTADSDNQKMVKRGQFIINFVTEVSEYTGNNAALLNDKQAFNTRLTLALNYAKLDVSGLAPIDQENANRALFEMVSGTVAQSAANEATAKIAAKATAARAVSAAANAAAGSTAGEDIHAQLTRLYVALLNRTPDSAGLELYSRTLQANGGSQQEWIRIANIIIDSEESKKDSTLTKVPALSNTAFVERVYTLALGERPDSSGAAQEMNALVDRLNKGASRGEVALAIVSGLLTYNNLSAKDVALKARFNNKVGVGLAAAVNLGGFDWSGNGATYGRDVLNAVTATDTEAALNKAYGIARLAYMTSLQPTIDAARVAKTAADTAKAAAAANVEAKSALDRATADAAKVASASVRLQVMQMYVGLLGRTPATYRADADLDGLEYVVARSGTDMAAVAQGFLDSEEGKKIYGNITDPAQFVRAVAATILNGVTPDPRQMEIWTAQLRAAPAARGIVAWNMLQWVVAHANGAPDIAGYNLLIARQNFMQRVSESFAIVNAEAQRMIGTAEAVTQELTALEESLPGLSNEKNRTETQRQKDYFAATSALNNLSTAQTFRLKANMLSATLSPGTFSPSDINYYWTVERSLESIAEQLITSNSAAFPTDGRQFIIGLYNTILGRPAPLANEVDLWLNKLNATTGNFRRGTIAVAILNSFMAYSDSKPEELEYKLRFDTRFQTLINQAVVDAGTAATNAETARGQAFTNSQNAATAHQNAVSAIKTAKTAMDTIGNSDDYKYGTMFQDAVGQGNQATITTLYLGIRGSVDFNGLATLMFNYNSLSSAQFRSKVIADLIVESDNTLPVEKTAFINEIFQRATGKPPTANEKNQYLSMTREAIAGEVLNLPKSKTYLTPRVNNQVAIDKATAKQRLDKYADAKAAYDGEHGAVAAEEAARQAAVGSTNDLSRADTILTNAINAAADYKKLQDAVTLIIIADTAWVAAQSALKAYTDADQEKSKLKTQLADLVTQTAGLSANTQAANTAAAWVTFASASSGVAQAYVAEKSSAIANQTVRQITQLYLAVLGRAPQLAELRLMSEQLVANGNDLTKLAQLLLETREGAALSPPGISNDEFITRLFQRALDRGFANDPNGLNFWSMKLSPPESLSKAALVSSFVNGVYQLGNDDSVTLHKRTAASLQTMLDRDTTPSGIDAAMARATELSEELARKNAQAYNAANVAKAAQTPLAQHVTPLTRLYMSLFNRAPELAALPFWIDKLTQGNPPLTMEQLANSMVSSDEALAYQTMSDSAFLRQVYLNTAGYSPSEAQLSSYLAVLASKGRGAAMLSLINAIADGPITGNLVQSASRSAYNAKVAQAVANSAAALGKQAEYKEQAHKLSLSLAASKPVDLHFNGVVRTAEFNLEGAQMRSAPLLDLDRWGNVLRLHDARNPNWAISYTYNHDNQKLTQTVNALAGSEKVAFSTINYDALGRQATSTDFNTNRTNYFYDANGNVVTEGRADGGRVTSTYNLFGQRLSVKQLVSNDGGVEKFGPLTSYAYDHLGRMTSVSVSAADGSNIDVHSATFYDVQERDKPIYQSMAALTTRYTYDELGRNTSITAADGALTERFYDLGGNLVKNIASFKSHGERFTPKEHYPIPDGPKNITLNRYNAFGHLIAMKDANNNTMTWSTDAFGRVTEHKDLGGGLISTKYNAAGQKIEQTTRRTDVIYADKVTIRYGYTGTLLTSIDQGPATVEAEGGDIVTKEGMLTIYEYDRMGNRTRELQRYTTGDPNAPERVQNNTLTYDMQNRVSSVKDDLYTIKYSYDDNGNRMTVHTFSATAGDLGMVYNRYDVMNRQIIVNGQSTDGGNTLTHGANGNAIEYDLAGNRLRDTFTGLNVIYDSNYKSSTTQQPTRETYYYDNIGRLSYIQRDGVTIDERRYDEVGRITESGQITYVASTGKTDAVNKRLTSMAQALGVEAGTTTYHYDNNGRVQRQTIRDTSGAITQDYYYVHDKDMEGHKLTGGYDAVGNLLGYTIYIPGRDNKDWGRFTLSYTAFDSYKELSNSVNGGGINHSVYDLLGNRTSVASNTAVTSQYWYDAAGHVQSKVTYDEKGENGKESFSLIINDQVLGYENNDATNVLGSAYIGARSPVYRAPPSAYTIQNTGETLQGIAQSVWGDSKLWYMIADANGIDAGEELKVGRVLNIPTRVNTVHNDYATFKPYDAAEAIGNTTPALPPPSSKGGGCGGMGQLIMVVVAVAVTYITAGAAANALFAAYGGTAAAAAGTTAAAAAAAGSVAGAVSVAAGAAIGGAVGSIASQAVGIGIGAQEGFEWKSVASSALAGAITGGVTALGDAGALTGVMKGSEWTAVASRAALSNALTQGVANLTGLQKGFSWAGVAASYAGAAVGSQLGGYLEKNGTFGDIANSSTRLANATASGFAAGLTTAVARGGKIAVAQIATDAFGNALGNSLASLNSGTPDFSDSEWDKLKQDAIRGPRLASTLIGEPGTVSDVATLGDMTYASAQAAERSAYNVSVLGAEIVDGIPSVTIPAPGPSWMQRNIFTPAGQLLSKTGEVLSEAGQGMLSWVNDTFVRPSGSTSEMPQYFQYSRASGDSVEATRRAVNSYRAYYPSGPAFVAVDPAREASARAQAQRTGNSLAMGLGGGFVALPMLMARGAGLSENIVGDVGMLGFAGMELFGARGGPRPPSLPISRTPTTVTFGTPVLSANRISGETSSTATGKAVHAQLAAERRASGLFDLVNQPLVDVAGKPVQVTKRVDLTTGEPIQSSGFQISRPDAVRFRGDIIVDDKPMGRPITKDRQEIIRFINAYSESQGTLPRTIGIQRYDPRTGTPIMTELYTPYDFMPWMK